MKIYQGNDSKINKMSEFTHDNLRGPDKVMLLYAQPEECADTYVTVMMSNPHKLGVVVVGAHNLYPEDDEGSCSAFVELSFDGLRLRTTVKEKDLNPVWNESFYFNISESSHLDKLRLDAYVYHSVKPTYFKTKSFLGKIRIPGDSLSTYSDDIATDFLLEKRGIFSHVRGELTLKVYVTGPEPSNMSSSTPTAQEQLMTQGISNPATRNAEEAETRHTSHRLPNPSHHENQPRQRPAAPPFSIKDDTCGFALKETSPNLGGGQVVAGRFINGPKTASAYDLVERMDILYVKVVNARDLPSRGVTGSLNPFVEVKAGNYKGTTKHFEKQKNPVWNQVFAFSKERMQMRELEVLIKHKDPSQDDDIVGYVTFPLHVVPTIVPPESPLEPKWYPLEGQRVRRIKGEVMLAVWYGTQADTAFSEAWHSDTVPLNSSQIDSTVIRSKIYQAPRLWYVRVNIIEAQDLFVREDDNLPNAYVRLKIGNQDLRTKPVQDQNLNPIWNEEFLFVTTDDPFPDLVLSVEDRVGNKDTLIGSALIKLHDVQMRVDDRSIPSRWFNLEKSSVTDHPDDATNEVLLQESNSGDDTFSSRKEDTMYSMRQLITVVISAHSGAAQEAVHWGFRARNSRYILCSKYGDKWVRTRTIVDNLSPKYNEQYNWEVFDPATVLTVGVFDNSELLSKVHGDSNTNNSGNYYKHQRIGRVRIRISTLEVGRIYTHSYPLVTLHPSGVKKMGELHLAIRFLCPSLLNRLYIYSQPLLPKMHYVSPISDMESDRLHFQAVNLVAAWLVQDELPLRKEVVTYMCDIDVHMFSLRRSKANFFRVMSTLSGLFALFKWFSEICMWKNPIMTVLVHVLFFMLVRFPQLIFPTIFIYLFLTGLWNFRFRPLYPPHISTGLSYAELAHPDELDEEFDSFPTTRRPDIVRMRYDRLRSVAGRIQTLAGDVAVYGERIQALLSWRDSLATALFVTFCFVAALVFYFTPIHVVVALAWLLIMMPPRFRRSWPSGPINFFRRLPAKADILL
ncbi:C2 calcium/lipid-binding plant phosphoribosyltransferase family protein [Prunus dulcis]|uniref:C2 calcium/lipid-binding plant phosphoribosyltransferase family protein n=1 Tax=Prunus dulcis TaxID=3755 RepID=A0A4Y1RAS6_PRUDU|nr:C2 calcium/lipid-binding plant phosphoribosyltransferase family protein [Prunus dulcis]